MTESTEYERWAESGHLAEFLGDNQLWFWNTVPDEPAWAYEAVVVVDERGVSLRRLVVAPFSETAAQPELTRRVLAKLNLVEIRTVAVEHLQKNTGSWTAPSATGAAQPPKRRRPDTAFLPIVQAYIDDNQGPGMAARLAAKFRVKEHTVNNRIAEARRRGLLVGGKRGQATAVLTEKAQRLLQEGGDGTR